MGRQSASVKPATSEVYKDDKRLTQTLKRLGLNTIPDIEEVNLFKDDGSVIHLKNPKVQANKSRAKMSAI